MRAVLVLVAVIVVMLAGAILVSRYLIRKAVRNVVTLLRILGATGPETAATAEQLGLARAGIYDGLFKRRDYRPNALLMLTHAGVVKMTEDGKFYLSEEDLADSSLKVSCRIKSGGAPHA